MNRKIKVLFIVPYPTEGPSNRLRIEQYFPYLKSHSVYFTIRPFASRGFFKILYKEGFLLLKICYFITSSLYRILDLLKVISYDIIFIHREMSPMGPPIFEYIIAKIKKPIIFDFDDAIFLPNISRPNRFIERFKMPQKTSCLVALSKAVIVTSKYLRDFALKFNPNVTIIPTPINTDYFKPMEDRGLSKRDIVIGWIGGPTTVGFLSLLEKVFKTLSLKYKNLKFKVIGGRFQIEGLFNILSKPWRLKDELDELKSFDIGIMPMPDNNWTRGKYGFKTTLYMSMGIPVVCSPVGGNVEIIQDGVNGFLADSIDNWIEKLSMLIENPELRMRMGREGRKLIEEKYSLKICAPRFLSILEEVYNKYCI